jgi:hypothetical protein
MFLTAILIFLEKFPKTNIADPGCLSRILDPVFTHPGSWIQDLGSQIQKQQQKRGEFCCHTLFSSHNFHKIENNFIFEMLKKKFGPIFKEL